MTVLAGEALETAGDTRLIIATIFVTPPSSC
jgi:hypothetical protein